MLADKLRKLADMRGEVERLSVFPGPETVEDRLKLERMSDAYGHQLNTIMNQRVLIRLGILLDRLHDQKRGDLKEVVRCAVEKLEDAACVEPTGALEVNERDAFRLENIKRQVGYAISGERRMEDAANVIRLNAQNLGRG